MAWENFVQMTSLYEKEIHAIYQWDATNLEHPKWSQAFSTDIGKTWE